MMDVTLSGANAPPGLILVAREGVAAYNQMLEFFITQIPNRNTRTAYQQAVRFFLEWCDNFGVERLADIRPPHIAAWMNAMFGAYAVPSVKLKLSAVTVFLDWMVVKHVIQVNPAKSVRSPRYSLQVGKTPVMSALQARELLDAIGDKSLIDRRDRALVALMLYTFVRIGAALSMKRRDVVIRGSRVWVRLHEKGGKVHEMPCHHELEAIIHAYLADCIGCDDNAFLFQSISRSSRLTGRRLLPANAHDRIGRRALSAGFDFHISCHSFRATGITTYLANRGTLEMAARMANHSSTRTTQLYDRRGDEIAVSEVERIRYE